MTRQAMWVRGIDRCVYRTLVRLSAISAGQLPAICEHNRLIMAECSPFIVVDTGSVVDRVYPSTLNRPSSPNPLRKPASEHQGALPPAQA
jgi:hypothetical protein